MLHLNTIGQLAEYLRDLHLEVGSLQEQLELVYRWRGSSNGRRRTSRKVAIDTGPGTKSPYKDSQNAALQAVSLKDAVGSAEEPINLEDDIAGTTQASVDDSGMFVDEPVQGATSTEEAVRSEAKQTLPLTPVPIPVATEPSHVIDHNSTSQIDTSPSSTPMDVWDIANKAEVVRGQEEGSIIGTTKFVYREEEMKNYVQNTLAFWNGRVGSLYQKY